MAGDRVQRHGDVGDNLVAQHLRHREEVAHGIVTRHVLAEVHEHLFGIGAADAREPRSQHDPVGAQEPRIGRFLQAHRRAGQPPEQGVVTVRFRLRIGPDAVYERTHEQKQYGLKKIGRGSGPSPMVARSTQQGRQPKAKKVQTRWQ
jgi:hypothetical protein